MMKVLSRNSSLGSSGSAKAAAGSESPTKGVGLETPTSKKPGLGKFFGKLSKSPKKSPVKSSSSSAETPKTESSPMSTKEKIAASSPVEVIPSAPPAPQQAATGSTSGTAPSSSTIPQQVPAAAAVQQQPPSSSLSQAASAPTANNEAIPTSNTEKKNGGEDDAGSWTTYRQTRLKRISSWIYSMSLIFFFVSLYCGDLTPHLRSNQVLPPINISFADVVQGLSKIPTYKLALLEPRQTPALARGSVLHSGDYIYNCLADSKKADEACQPTYFQLKDDGTLLLAHGVSPSSSSGDKIWSSKGGKVKAATYEATYESDGALTVRVNGKKIWKQGKFWQSKKLRPWPLSA